MQFIKTVQKVGLYAHLRIGPYVCAEWNYGYTYFQVSTFNFIPYMLQLCLESFFLNVFALILWDRGFPVWLKYVPGISFRTDNGPFKVEI